MRGRIEMKKAIPIIFIAVTLLLAAFPIRTSAAAAYESYLSIREGSTFTYTYDVIPNDQTHQSSLTVNLPFVINTIEDINSSACNVTYTVTYKVLVDGIPKDQAHMTTRTISNSTNTTRLIYEATDPWQLFFIDNINTTVRSVDIPANASLPIGTGGFIQWDNDGVLSIAYIHTVIDGAICTVSIRRTLPSSSSVPGYSTALILIVAAIPTALLAYKIAKKARRERIE